MSICVWWHTGRCAVQAAHCDSCQASTLDTVERASAWTISWPISRLSGHLMSTGSCWSKEVDRSDQLHALTSKAFDIDRFYNKRHVFGRISISNRLVLLNGIRVWKIRKFETFQGRELRKVKFKDFLVFAAPFGRRRLPALVRAGRQKRDVAVY